jgi:hypothetical protein
MISPVATLSWGPQAVITGAGGGAVFKGVIVWTGFNCAANRPPLGDAAIQAMIDKIAKAETVLILVIHSSERVIDEEKICRDAQRPGPWLPSSLPHTITQAARGCQSPKRPADLAAANNP